MHAQKNWSERFIARFLAAILLVVSMVSILELLLIMWSGGEWNYLIHASHARNRVFCTILSAFGWGCEQGQNYISVLESNLNQHAEGFTYETLNFAVPGYNTELELECLKQKGLAFHPDVVVIGWCDNDFGLPCFVPQEGQWNRKDISFLYYLFFDRKKFADVALSRIRDLRDFDPKKIPDYILRETDETGVTKCFLEFMRLGKEHHFQVLVFGPMNRYGLAVCHKIGIPYYNTAEKIPEGKYPGEYNLHFMHPAPEGHKVLAEYLERELRERSWLVPHSQSDRS